MSEMDDSTDRILRDAGLLPDGVPRWLQGGTDGDQTRPGGAATDATGPGEDNQALIRRLLVAANQVDCAAVTLSQRKDRPAWAITQLACIGHMIDTLRVYLNRQ